METKSYILKREEFLSKGKLINKFMPLERGKHPTKCIL